MLSTYNRTVPTKYLIQNRTTYLQVQVFYLLNLSIIINNETKQQFLLNPYKRPLYL